MSIEVVVLSAARSAIGSYGVVFHHLSLKNWEPPFSQKQSAGRGLEHQNSSPSRAVTVFRPIHGLLMSLVALP